MNQYRIDRITRIPSGDQLEMIADLGFYVTAKIKVVLEGIECPEIGEFVDGKDIGLVARDFVVTWFREKPQPWTVITRQKMRGTENTWVATILDAQGGALSDALLGAGHATSTES
jgi:endonuclease YncB( thermonuclease family)